MEEEGKVSDPKPPGKANGEAKSSGSQGPGFESGRRSLLKAGALGAALLPYVAPAIQSILLSEAFAQAPLGSGGRQRFRTRDGKKVSPIPKKKGFGRFRVRE